MPFMNRIDATLADLENYLRYRIETGERTIEMPRELLPYPSPEEPAAVPKTGPRRESRRAPSRPSRPSPGPAPEPLDASDAQRRGRLDKIAAAVAACERCPLRRDRNKPVPGQGSPHPDILFVGEGPGAEEDRQGIPFVGRAGTLLTRMIEAMGYRRDEVFIGNIVKCRPPDNRNPTPEEMQACLPWLQKQIEVLQPKVIVCLGAVAVKGLLATRVGISRLRGHWTQYEGIPVMPTYHPAYLLRYNAAKRDTWEDLKKVLRKLGRPVPRKKSQPSRIS